MFVFFKRDESMVLIMKHFLYYPLGFRLEGNQVRDISGLEESAKGGHREHKKDRLRDIKP